MSACNLWKRFALLRPNIIISITNGRCKNNKWSNMRWPRFGRARIGEPKTAGRDDITRPAFKNRHGSTSAAMHFVLLWCPSPLPPKMLTITPVGFIGHRNERNSRTKKKKKQSHSTDTRCLRNHRIHHTHTHKHTITTTRTTTTTTNRL